MILFKYLRNLKKSFNRHTPSVEVLIYKNNLLENLKEYKRQYPKLSLAPVLKSNAYGHGILQIARILDKEPVAFFVLDSLYEAMSLRHDGQKSPILVIGYTSPDNIKNSKLSNVAFTITSIEQLREIARLFESRQARLLKTEKTFHLKIDTGMHRQGILPEQINDAIKIIKTSRFINLEGVCSHFADADNPNNSFTKLQISRWEKAIVSFKQNFPKLKFFHISATTGIPYSKEVSANVARIGMGLYGINSSPLTNLNLKPVLQMRSTISSLKNIPAGESVGYSITYKTPKPIRVATVPAGYFEGVDRRLSNNGFFKITNQYCPIVGKISMNMTSVDITSLPETKFGDEVIIISNNKSDLNSAEQMAKLTNTTPYEILARVPQHLRRTVIE